MFSTEQKQRLVDGAKRHGITPANCPNCEYDRRFPDTRNGGWVYPGSNASIVACPMCNADESHPRDL